MWKLILLTEFAAAQCAVTPGTANTFVNVANPCANITGDNIDANAVCIAACAAGFVPSQAPATCSGTTGFSVACELGCNVAATAATETNAGTITNVCSNVAGQTWVGNTTPGNQTCTPACDAGYVAGTLADCAASDGTATDLNFTCSVATTSCLIRNTSATGAATSNCASSEAQDYNSANRVSLVLENDTCTFQCADGFKVDGGTASVDCSGNTAAGPNSYTDFTCVDTCAVVASSGASCTNADTTSGELASSAVCTASCAANNVPEQTIAQLTCTGAADVSLTCVEGCDITAASQNGPTGARCSNGKNWLSKDSECDLECASGNTAYPRGATCTTEGTDVSYNCYTEDSCVIARPTNGAEKICSEDSSSVTSTTPYTLVAQGSSCTTQCAYGYKASETTIACGATNALNAATPADSVFTCASDKCTVAAPSANGAAADALVKCGTGDDAVARAIVQVGATDCKFQCASDYTAFPETAACSTEADELTYECIKSTSCRIAAPAKNANSTANCENSDSGETFASGVTIIEDGKKCTLQCGTDYSSKTASITCDTENSIATKKDLTFECEEKDTTNSSTLGVLSALLLLASRI